MGKGSSGTPADDRKNSKGSSSASDLRPSAGLDGAGGGGSIPGAAGSGAAGVQETPDQKAAREQREAHEKRVAKERRAARIKELTKELGVIGDELEEIGDPEAKHKLLVEAYVAAGNSRKARVEAIDREVSSLAHAVHKNEPVRNAGLNRIAALKPLHEKMAAELDSLRGAE